MIELPYLIEFDVRLNDYEKCEFNFVNFVNELSNISPKPLLNFYLQCSNWYSFSKLFDFYAEYKQLYGSVKLFLILSDFTRQAIFYVAKIMENNPEIMLLVKTTDLENIIPALCFFKDAGIKSFTLIHSSINDNQTYFYTKFEETLDSILKKERFQNIYLIPYMEKDERKNFYTNKKQNRKFLTCAAPWLNPVVDTKGNLYCCCDKKIGNLNQLSFWDLWNSSDAQEIRDSLLKQKQFVKCNTCPYFYKQSFFTVENACFEYNGKKFCFNSSINFVHSSPKLLLYGDALDEQTYIVNLKEIYSTEQLTQESAQKNLLFILE